MKIFNFREKLPLYYCSEDIKRVYQLNLEHRKENIFEIVPQPVLRPGNVIPELFVSKWIRLKVSKSSYGITLLKNVQEIKKHSSEDNVLEFFNYTFFQNDPELSKQLHVVPDNNYPGKYYLAPNGEMLFTSYIYLIQKFGLNCCRKCHRF